MQSTRLPPLPVILAPPLANETQQTRIVRVIPIVAYPAIKRESSVPMNSRATITTSTDLYSPQTMGRHVRTFAPSKDESDEQ